MRKVINNKCFCARPEKLNYTDCFCEQKTEFLTKHMRKNTKKTKTHNVISISDTINLMAHERAVCKSALTTIKTHLSKAKRVCLHLCVRVCVCDSKADLQQLF